MKMTIEEIIKEAFSQGWNASYECATDFDYEYYDPYTDHFKK